MCFKIPGRVVEVRRDWAVVDYGGVKKTAGLAAVKPKKGDFVLVEAGFVTKRIPKKEAERALKLLSGS